MNPALRDILPTPHSLVSDGRFALGTYKAPFEQVNPLDARLGALWPWPRWFKRWRLKEWEHFALVNDEYYLSVALFNAKSLGLAQVCVYSRKDGALHFYERRIPPWKLRLPPNILDSGAAYESGGFSLRFENALSVGYFAIEIEIEASEELPQIAGRFRCLEPLDASEPIVVCLPLSNRGAMYSHKYTCPIEGSMTLGQDRADFSAPGSYGLIDIHQGYYPMVMKWHWATAGHRARDGRLIGFNLTDNQVEDQHAYNENCVWRDGRVSLLPPVTFSFDRRDYRKPWAIRDRDGMVELTFRPEVVRTVDVNALLFKSRYRAPFGSFSGHLRGSEGDEIEVDGCFGMCEDFYLRS
jgi:hypothetical protein